MAVFHETAIDVLCGVQRHLIHILTLLNTLKQLDITYLHVLVSNVLSSLPIFLRKMKISNTCNTVNIISFSVE